MKIICVIVTYNRKDLLKKSLDSVIKEWLKKENIILIDNNSTDWTNELIKNEYLDKLQYFLLNENIWWAWWFSYGLELAYNQWWDFFLLFDDDVEMIQWAINNYIKYIEKWDVIVWRKKNIDWSDFEFWHNISINNWNLKKISKYDRDLFIERDFIEMNAVTFEWVFFSRKVIEKIWFPEKDFFIQWDDAWFWLKAFLNWFKIIYIKDYTFIRLLWENVKIIFWRKMENLKSFSLYYQIRNKFLLNKFINTILNKKVNHSFNTIKFSILVFIYILFTQNNKFSLIKALFNWLKDWILWKTGK